MKHSKRQVLPAGLWVVATPIGNLADLTDRAAQALQEADVILCEDTRRASVLLSELGIPPQKLKRMDAHLEEKAAHHWVSVLQEGKNLALVTDAGTPGVSDPGSYLVAQARAHSIRVTPIPGPSAVAALLSVCGFTDTSFTFRGFFPRKNADRNQELQEASQSQTSRVFIWFESPFRIKDTVECVQQAFPAVPVVVGKELTKLHEKFFSGTATDVFQELQQEMAQEGEVGEWCFAIQFSKQERTSEMMTAAELALRCLRDAKVPASEAAKLVSQTFGISSNQIYDSALEIFGKKSSKGG